MPWALVRDEISGAEQSLQVSHAQKGLLRFLLGFDHKILNSPLFKMLDYKKTILKFKPCISTKRSYFLLIILAINFKVLALAFAFWITYKQPCSDLQAATSTCQCPFLQAHRGGDPSPPSLVTSAALVLSRAQPEP